MKKEKEFLNQLGIELKKSGFNNKKTKAIVLKYKKIIDERLDNKEKIYAILKDIGTPVSITTNEKSNNKESFSIKLKEFYEKITKDITINDIANKKDKKEKVNKKKLNTNVKENIVKTKKENKTHKKSKNNFFKNCIDKLKNKKPKKEKISNGKVTTKIKEKNTEKKIKDSFFKTLINNIKNSINKLKNNHNKKTSDKKTNKEKIKKVKDEPNDTEIEIKEIEKPVVILTSSQLKKKRIVDILNIIIITILILIWQWTLVLTFACGFAFLDGVRLIGIVILMFGISMLMLWTTIVTINSIYKKFNLSKLKIISLLTIIFIISLGIGTSIYQIYKLDTISDLGDKYKMTTKSNKYNMPKGDNNKMYILFNGNYDTQYIINYDNDLDGTFKIDVNYYEEYYDFYEKNSSNNIYISLRKDDRDIISTYISGLKDKKIYSTDELSRYVVRITISEKDYGRLVIED